MDRFLILLTICLSKPDCKLFLTSLSPQLNWSHEYMGTQLVEQIFDNNRSSFELDSETEKLIQNLIIGNSEGVSADYAWIFEIVNNKRNSLDVDKFDYLQRDMEHTGFDYNLDTSLLVDRCKVLNGQIAYPIDLHDQVSKVFSVRHKMF